MMRTTPVLLALALGLPPAALPAAEIVLASPKLDWSFNGPLGAYDRAELKRGLKVYREVCATCHSLDLVRYRDLRALGMTESEIKDLAAQYQIPAEPDASGNTHDASGNPITRPALPADAFAAPFANANAAKAANNGKVPPDLSLIAKSRRGGPDYIVALLTGYTDPPKDVKPAEGTSYNPFFPGHQIAMPPPLTANQVQYEDGVDATLVQMSTDVASFLMWSAEPKLEERKRAGLKVMGYLVVFFGLVFALKRRVWSDVH